MMASRQLLQEEPDQSGPSWTQIHDTLSNERRVLVLQVLHDERPEVSLRELADRVASLEADTESPPGNVRNSVYVSLHQSHLPKLDEYGIVDYDKDRKVVSLLDETVLAHLEGQSSRATHSRWDRAVVVLAAIGLLGTVLLWGPLDAVPIPATLLAIGVFVLIATVVLYRLVSSEQPQR